MVSLLPPNATTLERALEGAGQALLDIPVPLATLWSPQQIDVQLLPWLAWGLGVPSWMPYWPEQVKRNQTAEAINIARHRGTAKSVRDVVSAFGGSVQIREWWEMTPKGVPHTFELTLVLSGQGGQEATAKYVDDVIGEVERVKPARSHFTFTQGFNSPNRIGTAGAVRPVIYAHLQLAGAQ